MISVPHRRRQAFFTTAKASGRISFSRRASSSLSWILESSSFQAAVFWRRTSSESFCNSASKALILRDQRTEPLDLAVVLRADELLYDEPNHDCLDNSQTLREPRRGVKDINGRQVGLGWLGVALRSVVPGPWSAARVSNGDRFKRSTLSPNAGTGRDTSSSPPV